MTAMTGTRHILDRAAFNSLLSSLRRRGHTLIGPSVRGGAILWSEIGSAADLPAGWTDDQERGRYRLARRSDGALFGFTAGPDSLKKHFLPPSLVVLSSRKKKGAPEFAAGPRPAEAPPPKPAFIGVRACDLAALAVLDRVLAQGPFPDPHFADLRSAAFIVAVNCAAAGNTCFCGSMGTGPECRAGFDIAMTEIVGDGRHHFVCEAGSPKGAELLADAGAREASAPETEAADALLRKAAATMGRSLETKGVGETLRENFEHPRWNEVAKRCLTCANCTMVCPTCFCTTVEDTADLAGAEAGRTRLWDSCFTVDYSYIHGGSIRPSPRARYRQWLTHKLDSWQEQFGAIGCVGCGRCITWCPVGIDLTEEVQAIRNGGPAGPR